MDKALFNGWFRKNYFIPSIFLFSWAELFHASLSRTYLQQVRRICSRLQSPFPKPLVVLSSQLIHCVPEWVRLPLSRNCTLHSYPAIVSQQIVHRFEVMCTVEKHFLHDDDYEWRRLIYEKLLSNTRKTTIWAEMNGLCTNWMTIEIVLLLPSSQELIDSYRFFASQPRRRPRRWRMPFLCKKN